MTTRRFPIACVQLESDERVARNIERARLGVERAAQRGARLVVLPEKWNALGDADVLRRAAEPIDGATVTAVRAWARELRVWLLAGSMVLSDAATGRTHNVSLLVSPAGEVTAQYAKLHMFDVDIDGVAYRESDVTSPGRDVVTGCVDDVSIGMTVCYDVRFPELYAQLRERGASVVTVPAAFTERTGRDHWEVLLRARAIENQCVVAASNQFGEHQGKRSYGHSMIVDAWGTVIAQASDGEDVIVAEVDLDALERIRANMPVRAHRRHDVFGA